MTKNENGYGKAIRKARKSNGLTIDQLAQKVGVSERYIQKIENEDSKPSFEVLSRIVKILSLDANMLFYQIYDDSNFDMNIVIKKIQECNQYEFNVIKATLLALMEKENTNTTGTKTNCTDSNGK